MKTYAFVIVVETNVKKLYLGVVSGRLRLFNNLALAKLFDSEEKANKYMKSKINELKDLGGIIAWTSPVNEIEQNISKCYSLLHERMQKY